MTLTEALRRKIHKLRLPFFPKGSFVDPRVTEKHAGLDFLPVITPGKPERDSNGNVYFPKILVKDLEWSDHDKPEKEMK